MSDIIFTLTCSVWPTDNNEKCMMGKGEGYRGTLSLSSSGAECINWNSTSLRGKKFTAKKVDATSLGLGNHNFCRYVTSSAQCQNIWRNKRQIFSYIHLTNSVDIMLLLLCSGIDLTE